MYRDEEAVPVPGGHVVLIYPEPLTGGIGQEAIDQMNEGQDQADQADNTDQGQGEEG